MHIKQIPSLLKATFSKWIERDPIAQSSTIAYYAIFSLPGLLIIAINIAGYFYDKKEDTTKISSQLEQAMGPQTANDIISIIDKAGEEKETVLSSILSVITLLLGATGVFAQLQKFLNQIWEVPPPTKRKFLYLLKERLFSFGLVLAVGFLLLVSLLLSTVLGALSSWVTSYVSESLQVLFNVLDVVVSFAIVTVLFAAIFKFLPDTKITWRQVWPGAIITSILFVIAKFALGIYFGRSEPESAYGAAGSIVLVLLWVSYSSIIVLFGAEFTHQSSDQNVTERNPREVSAISNDASK